MNKKQFKELDRENTWLKIGFLIFTVIILILSVRIEKTKEENILLKENNTLTYNLETMSNNCGNEFGSMLITKEYGKGDYSIYKNECNSKGYCKYIYIPIEECLI
jgi:hypothetical protein